MACADDKEHATLWEISLLSLSYGNEPLRPSVLASIQNGPSHTQFYCRVHVQHCFLAGGAYPEKCESHTQRRKTTVFENAKKMSHIVHQFQSN